MTTKFRHTMSRDVFPYDGGGDRGNRPAFDVRHRHRLVRRSPRTRLASPELLSVTGGSPPTALPLALPCSPSCPVPMGRT